MQEKRFHYFCSSHNLVFNLVMKHIFSFVMNIQAINWKPNGWEILYCQSVTHWNSEEGREDFIISWAWAHDVLLMLKRLMQSLQSTCTWKHRVGVERWHYRCTWHQYIVIKITDCSENPSKNWKGSGRVWENHQNTWEKKDMVRNPDISLFILLFVFSCGQLG